MIYCDNGELPGVRKIRRRSSSGYHACLARVSCAHVGVSLPQSPKRWRHDAPPGRRTAQLGGLTGRDQALKGGGGPHLRRGQDDGARLAFGLANFPEDVTDARQDRGPLLIGYGRIALCGLFEPADCSLPLKILSTSRDVTTTGREGWSGIVVIPLIRLRASTRSAWISKRSDRWLRSHVAPM